ncbi:MAG: response regulator transcription factor [Clostridia bacterium]|nr:response regulator transcription factor [Clostridia bacterium]
MIQVLLVEDDAEIARIIKYYLAQEDIFEVTWVNGSERARDVSHNAFDIILMDIMLPDTDGITLCAQLRKWHRCPILFISCLDDSDTIIRALECGGDDYITKPFDTRVLNAKILANYRRSRMEKDGRPDGGFKAGPFTLDYDTQILYKDGKPIPLVAMESRIIAYFIQNPNRYFRPQELYKQIWGKLSYGDNRTVTVHIYNLRKKIELDPSQPRYLKSVWGKGYIFDPEGRVLDEKP